MRLAIDTDPDNDGLLTTREMELGTNPDKRDTDGDLLPDGWEVARGLDPLQHDGDAALALDPDGDGVRIAHELAAGTDPHNASSFVNEAPTGLALSSTAVTENAAGATVGTLSASDPDSGDTLSYSHSGTDASSFELSGTTLKLKSGVSAD